MSFRYALCLLSCGREEYVRRTLASYVEHLTPPPSAVYVYDDGGQTPLDAFDAWPGVEVKVESHPTRLGRCAAHANLWRYAAASDYDYVWTVEDDVLLLRPLDLRDLAALLESEPDLIQVTLFRCPWGAEVEYGGYFNQFRWKYERRSSWLSSLSYAEGDGLACWIASTDDWASSPALVRAQVCREVDWPAEPGCELTLGPAVQAVQPEALSGYWGWGEPLAAHIGMERVQGGHGY